MILSPSEVKDIIKANYNMQVSVDPLAGYDEDNYLLKDEEQKRYICKVTDTSNLPFLDAQVTAMVHLANRVSKQHFQQPVLDLKGEMVSTFVHHEKMYSIRISSFIDGVFWAEMSYHSPELLNDLGSFLAKADKALSSFQHPAAHRYYTWDVANALDARTKLQYISDHEKRRTVAYFLLQFETEVQPLLRTLRAAVIHNDANDLNVLVEPDGSKVAGLIDFGDMVYSPLINNLAVACTYAMFGQTNPINTAATIIGGYHQQYPLTEQEAGLLYYLIAARLCISVTESAYQARHSSNMHHFVSENDAWKLLFKLLKTNPLKVLHEFRLACGFSGAIDHNDDHESLMADRKERIGANLSIGYKKHLKIDRAAFQYLYDDKGKTYIDCVNNVSHVGHCHPTVVKAMQQQVAKLNTNTRYLHDGLVDYAARLCATLPKKLQVCYFTNSGSEANDLAIRMSRHFTKQKDVIVLDHAYHGTSTVAMELSPYKFDGKGGSGKAPYIHKAMNPDLYRGTYRYGDALAGQKYADDILRIINELGPDKSIAAFICETLLGVGGQIPLPQGYLKEVYAHVRKAGGVCIADEVQVGFGRVGDAFWGFELQGVEPDIVVLGKPIGNGHPLAAVIVTREIADAFNNGMEYFNTYGGNPVSMATGMAVMDVIKNEELQENALMVGNYLMRKLKSMIPYHELIGDVRGHGLFIGVELVKSRTSLEPAVAEIDRLVEKMKDRGFLLSTDGPFHNVIKIKPPLVFNIENADALAQNLDEVFTELASESKI